MGFFSKAKNFLVEDTNDESLVVEDAIEYESSSGNDCDVVVNVDNTDFENIIQDVYEQNNIEDMSRSIYKVEEIIKTLPSTMPDSTKKVTVLNICKSFGLQVEELVEDASTRTTVLAEVATKVFNENTDAINCNNMKIEECKKIIEELEKENQEMTNEINVTKNEVEKESSKLLKLVEFICNEVND